MKSNINDSAAGRVLGHPVPVSRERPKGFVNVAGRGAAIGAAQPLHLPVLPAIGNINWLFGP